MIDKLIVMVFCGMVMLMIAMELLFCGLPLFRRLEFDAVCHKYMLLMDRTGCLTEDISNQLNQDLVNRGFSSVDIQGTREADFGDPLELNVMSNCPGFRVSSNLCTEEVAISLVYHSSTLCRVMAD